MVNQVILSYLRTYKNKYSLKDLKSKIISAGYSKKAIDEVVRVLNEKNKKPKVNQDIKPEPMKNLEQTTPNRLRSQAQKGFKWMKFGGWLGVVLLVFSVLSFVLSFVKFNPLTSLGILGTIISIILAVGLIAAALFFIFGFVKLGKYSDSRLLKFSAKVLFGLMIAYVILIIVIIIFVIPSWSSGFFGSDSVVTGNVVPGLATSSAIADSALFSGGFSILIWIVGIIVLLVSLFLIVVMYLFFVSLIKIRKQVRFAKSAGILGLILITLSILSSIAMIIVATNPFIMLSFMLNPSYLIIILIANIVFSLAGFVLILLESLVLFDGSKKFEG